MNRIARAPKDIGNELRRVRKEAKLSQRELAERVGLWQETISKIENDASATKLETIFDICAALDLELIISPRSKGSNVDLEDIL
jgi:HTH-type transcriptional regulator / antitoxin HipB